MRLESILVEALPSCSWCLDAPKSLLRPVLIHGSRVEVRDDFFFEGAWAGSWDRPPQPHAAVFGTGGTFRRGRIDIYTSIFKKHGVFLVQTDDAFYFSNSIPLLLAYTGRALTLAHLYCWHYHMAVSLGWRGIGVGLHRLPLDKGALAMFFHGRVVLDSHGVRAVKHFGPRIRKGVNFREYVDMLTAQLEAALENATDPSRRHPASGSIATMSSGYDSIAVAVLGRQLGCVDGLTIDDGVGDSGAAIGEALGMNMRVLVPSESRDATGLAAIFAMPGNTVHTPWLTMRPFLQSRVVLTGWLGDTMWAVRRCSKIPREFASRTGFGGLPEARLWFDSTFLPIVATGDADQDRLVELSDSPAMSRYRTGTDYDRPIPHRIATDAAVNTLIGNQKRAGSVAKVNALPSSAHQEICEIAGELRLERSSLLDTVGRQQYELAGWECDELVPGPRMVALEAIFRWAVRHLGREYTSRLGGAGDDARS